MAKLSVSLCSIHSQFHCKNIRATTEYRTIKYEIKLVAPVNLQYIKRHINPLLKAANCMQTTMMVMFISINENDCKQRRMREYYESHCFPPTDDRSPRDLQSIGFTGIAEPL